MLAGDDAEKQREVDFGVMVMGGAPDPVEKPAPTEEKTAAAVESTPMDGVEKPAASSPAPAQGPSGTVVLETGEFWDDLQGFLEQRLKDVGEAARLKKVFYEAWKAGGAEKRSWFSRRG